MARRSRDRNENNSSESIGFRPGQVAAPQPGSPRPSSPSYPQVTGSTSSTIQPVGNPFSGSGYRDIDAEIPRTLNPGSSEERYYPPGENPGTVIANASEAVRDPSKHTAPRYQRGPSAVRDLTQAAPKGAAKRNVAEDRRPHCKTRPNRAKGGKGGGKGFVPWC